MTYPELVAHLTATRIDRGLTQRELAAKIGVADTTLSSWETHVREPGAQNFIAWITALGISLS